MSLEKKISAISSVPENIYIKTFENIRNIQADDVITQLKNNDVATIETIEGNLMIKIEDDEIKYKFIPSEAFSKLLISGITRKESPLVTKLSEQLKYVLTHTYKDIVS